MKTLSRSFLLLVIASLFVACGYRNPNIYTGPDKKIYITEWKNRTSELGLDAKLYRSLTRWFQKSRSIATVRAKEGADLILAGEVISLELPSLSYGAGNLASEVKVRLRVRYIVKDISSNKILLEVADQTWEESYLASGNSSTNQDNESKALDKIIEDMSQKIYQRTIAGLSRK